MAYYRKRHYRSWRSRGSNSAPTSKFSVLQQLLGNAVRTIRDAFLHLDEDALDEIFSDYGSIYGEAAERYARNTFPNWKVGATKLSGQTMERLVELVPPYLSPSIRFSLLCEVLKKHKPSNSSNKHIKINVKEPSLGFQQLQEALDSMTHDAVLAHLPENVMKAVSWLYDDDITAARAMLAEAESLENDSIRSSARREIELLRRTIQSGQIKAASYNVTMPAGKLSVIAYTPSKCYVATVCFGQDAPETNKLRAWRDDYLLNYEFGKNFVVWYYNNGEKFADIAKKHPAAKLAAKILIRTFTLFVAKHKLGARDGR